MIGALSNGFLLLYVFYVNVEKENLGKTKEVILFFNQIFK